MTFLQLLHGHANKINKEYPGFNILLFGRPGAGKGTLAYVFEELGYIHVGVGTILRGHANSSTKESCEIIKAIGQDLILEDKVADTLVIPKLKNCLEQKQSFVLEGYPVTQGQADTFSKFVEESGDFLILVYLEVGKLEASRRLLHRKSCLTCHASYCDDQFICRACGSLLGKRYDDTAKLIKERQAIYERETAPILSILQKKFPTHSISAESPDLR